MKCIINIFEIFLFRSTTRKVRQHLSTSDCAPNYYRRIRGGPSRGGPVNPPSNMEFLRGIYAVMQVSRSTVSINRSMNEIILILYYYNTIYKKNNVHATVIISNFIFSSKFF